MTFNADSDVPIQILDRKAVHWINALLGRVFQLFAAWLLEKMGTLAWLTLLLTTMIATKTQQFN
ncbi:hypothetical protein [Rhodopirellula bahusiensis]|uniref:hypothetical protein n=1 Tax=Rhodopirellula bahusiensis TaxID=2014065 RepID=UPI00117B86C7|nr:hypothetical protein [Rhodopirellula bahusiensis]